MSLTIPRGFRRLPSLRSQVTETLVLAFREDTTELEDALRAEGFAPIVLRPEYSAVEMTYSRTIRCLLNHAAAWRRAAVGQGLTLVLEADFVPCRGFGDLPMPFDPTLHGSKAWAYLYTGGPRIFRQFADGTFQGHSATPVACVMSPQVAGWLCEYVPEELARHGDLTRYSLWDTQHQWYIMGKGAMCFMPWRSYGEHGGLANPEHRQAGTGLGNRKALLRWLGLGRNHHAEVLYGPLRFLPLYAQTSRWRYRRVRFEAKLTALAKLLVGRVVHLIERCSVRTRIRLYVACFVRLCSPY